MKEISFEELKILQLEMLSQIDTFCKAYGIKYFLSSGTMLGAVRHRGYIPWDDDIDITMPRPDYNRFLEIFNGRVENLVVAAPELDWNYYAPYANVYDRRTFLEEGGNGHCGIELGVKIDVFPLDGIPKDDSEYKRDTQEILKLNKILYAKRYVFSKSKKLSFKSFIAYFYRKVRYFFVPYSSIQKRIHEIATKIPYNEAEFVNFLTMDNGPLYKYHRSCFDSQIYWDFENFKFPIPIGYDEYLTVHYKDYMKLPPIDKQVPHHGFKAYWKN